MGVLINFIMKTCLYVGSFDPFTIGHKSIVDRCLQLFDKVIIGIGNNPYKGRVYDLHKTLLNISDIYNKESKVEVYLYDGLTIDLAKKYNVDCLVRGIRNTTDFEYEKSLAEINKDISGIETLFLMTEPELSHVSSSMVRELVRHGKDVSKYIPKRI